MTVDGARPLLANSARALGARIGNGPHDDIPLTGDDEVVPGTGGMSVAPDWRSLPFYRIPRRLRTLVPEATGNNSDACWRLGEGSFADGLFTNGLILRVDSKIHGLIEPTERCPSSQYLSALQATRNTWEIDES